MSLRNRDYELEDLIVFMAFPWFAVFWGFIGLMICMTLDLDQSWFDPDRVAVSSLALRIFLFWPVWSIVQLGEMLEDAGVQAGMWWPLLGVVTTVLPAALLGWICMQRGVAERS